MRLVESAGADEAAAVPEHERSVGVPVATHDAGVAALADRMLSIEDGTLGQG